MDIFSYKNKLMESYLKKVDLLKNKEVPGDLYKLLKLIMDGFVIYNGCILFKSHFNSITKKQFSELTDKTSYEAFINHVHLSDFIKKSIGIYSLYLAVSLAHILYLKLKKSFPRKRFIIIVSYKKKDHCIIRFYKYRKGEPPWLDPDLNKYKEAIGVISF